jgi:signal transduction histidine kinase
VRARAHGETSINEVVDIEAFDGVRKVIQNSAVPIRDANDRITGAVIVNEDVSARMTAEHERNDALTQLRTLTGRLIRAQDDERRRIAQLLHETTAQDLAALKMHLARLVRTEVGLSSGDRGALAESIELAERSMSGIRTLSYLLHPPFLDEAGLLSALRWYAAGFAKRSGIEIDLDLPLTFERLPQDVETTLFRVVQEALLNIHHHAGSPIALIRLRVESDRLLLEIVDRGRGMPSTATAELPAGGGALGVGVAGMRERLQELGGTFEIESSDEGTTVRAQVPLSRDSR